MIESLEYSVLLLQNRGDLKNLIKKFDNGIFLDSQVNEVNAIVKIIEDKKYREIL